MKTLEIKGKVRKELGKKATIQVRKSEEVPCVLYGGKENIHFSATAKDLELIVYTPEVLIAELNIDGKKVSAIMQELQFHPVTDKLLHIDFLEVIDGKPITVKLPVELTGFAKGVKAGGKIVLVNRLLTVKGLAKNMPERLSVNVDELDLGKTIKVGELKFENLEIINSKNDVVCAIKATRASKEAAE